MACLGALVLMCACHPNEDAIQDEQMVPPEQENALTVSRLISVYESPDGQPTQELKAGSTLQLTGEVSGKLYYQSTRKDTLLEPYLKVILPNKASAWVYADPANFNLPSTTSLDWQWNNRLRSLLSPNEVTQYYQVWDNWQTTEQASVLLLTFQATRELRDKLKTALRNYPLLPLKEYQKLLPACWAYASSGSPGWWLDFNQWASHRAAVTEAGAVEALFSFYQKEIYPPDGIEYHFTSWDFPISPQQKHSLLGRRIHFGLLEKLQQLTRSFPFIEAECLLLKEQLVHDICDPGTTYWEEWPAIHSELDTILRMESWTILNPQDLSLLQHRIQALEMPNMQELYLGHRNK